jgi:hypothetical protein
MENSMSSNGNVTRFHGVARPVPETPHALCQALEADGRELATSRDHFRWYTKPLMSARGLIPAVVTVDMRLEQLDARELRSIYQAAGWPFPKRGWVKEVE